MQKAAIVTGGTSGIGLETVRALERAGVKAYALSRHAVEGVEHIVCDVSDEASVRLAVSEVVRRARRVDILINCAGYGISGAVEYTDPSDARRQIDVNLFGADRLIRAVLPVMRTQGKGRVVCVSSVAAVAPIPFQAWYSASKAGLNALTMALRNELKPLGVSVCAVMPGDVKTGFTAARVKSDAGDEAYGGRVTRSVAKMEHDEQTGMSAAAAGEKIAAIALKRRVRPYYALGLSYKACCALIKLLPARTACWVIGRLYAS
ncbi:MAG: SDR family NAD(P)-dependent oxidoreductase [Clostridia bacterium]|nr:SDR family NAD(P)-dependent oxidoreductase [Clostridia bacterium]